MLEDRTPSNLAHCASGITTLLFASSGGVSIETQIDGVNLPPGQTWGAISRKQILRLSNVRPLPAARLVGGHAVHVQSQTLHRSLGFADERRQLVAFRESLCSMRRRSLPK